MGKTKTTSKQLPRGSSFHNNHTGKRKHFDSVDPLFANEHYGRYLVVKNNESSYIKHNRLYLCHDSMIEYTEAREFGNSVMGILKNKGISEMNLISRFPSQHNFILESLHSLIEESSSRKTVEELVRGFSHFLSVFEKFRITFLSLDEINANHLKVLEKDAKDNRYADFPLRSCVRFLNDVIKHLGKHLKIPVLRKYAVKSSKGDELSLAVSWQCDVYACKELDETMRLVNEYQKWMKELKTMQAPFSDAELELHGGLFTLKNLVFTYFNNFDTIGRSSGKKNSVIRRAALALYGVELKVWKRHRKESIEIKKKVDELKKIGEGGININVLDERMFAIWHKVIAPGYPFVKEYLPQYAFIQKKLSNWRSFLSFHNGFNLDIFDRRICPDKHSIYPIYLLSLCRTGLNQQPILDWRVWKDEQGIYHLGEDSGMGRIVDGFKGRGNTAQSTALDKKHQKYADFICEYLTPLYEHSKDNHFLQYVESSGTVGNSVAITSLTTRNIHTMYKGAKTHFFYTNTIKDTLALNDGTLQEKRLYRINHEKIRKINNLSEYLQGKQQWERQFGRGHKSAETEVIYQQTAEFQGSKQHRIASSMNELLDFFEGKISESMLG